MIRVPQFLLGFVMAHMVFVAHAAPSCILPEKAESGYDYNTNRDSYGKMTPRRLTTTSSP